MNRRLVSVLGILIGVPGGCLAGYKVTDGKVEICENPSEVETEFQEAFKEQNGTVYRPRAPTPKRTTQLRVPRAHFFHPLEDSLQVLNRVMYEKTLWGTNDGNFFYEQPIEEVEMVAQTMVDSIEPSYTITDVKTTTLHSIAHVCENPGDTPIECTIDPFDLQYSLWRGIADGFTFTVRKALDPVVLTIKHKDESIDLLWPYTEEVTGPNRTQYVWHQQKMSLQVPPNSVYRLIAELQHETVIGILNLKAHVISDGLDDFRWKIRTCAAPAKDERRRCKWIEQGYFQAKDVYTTLTDNDKIKICGSRHPRLCRLRFDDNGILYALASSTYFLAFSPHLTTSVIDAHNQTRIIDATVHIG